MDKEGMCNKFSGDELAIEAEIHRKVSYESQMVTGGHYRYVLTYIHHCKKEKDPFYSLGILG